MLTIKRDIYSTQAHSAWFCLQIGTTAYLFGDTARGRGLRIELFTPWHTFRVSHRLTIRARRWWRKVAS